MAQQQEQQAAKPRRPKEYAKQALASAAKSLKRVWAGRRLDKDLREAISISDRGGIKRLLKAGASITAKDEFGETALFHAAANGDARTCVLLIEKHKEANGNIEKLIIARDNDGETALHNAAFHGQTGICALLIDEYAKAGGGIRELIRMQDNSGSTSLYKATSNGWTETVQFLKSMEWLGHAMGDSFLKPFRACVAA
jgi:hypothetical protein